MLGYVDPGVGSFVLQALVAVVVFVAVVVRRSWHGLAWLVRPLARLFPRRSGSSDDDRAR